MKKHTSGPGTAAIVAVIQPQRWRTSTHATNEIARGSPSQIRWPTSNPSVEWHPLQLHFCQMPRLIKYRVHGTRSPQTGQFRDEIIGFNSPIAHPLRVMAQLRFPGLPYEDSPKLSEMLAGGRPVMLTRRGYRAQKSTKGTSLSGRSRIPFT
jgi:hypothetical protein